MKANSDEGQVGTGLEYAHAERLPGRSLSGDGDGSRTVQLNE